MALDFTNAIPLNQESNISTNQSNNNNNQIANNNNLDFSNAENIEISNLEKLEYGWDKTTNVVGNIFRIGKAKYLITKSDIMPDEEITVKYTMYKVSKVS